MRTLLVTGAAGQLGHRVLASAARRPHLAVVGCTRADLDITDPDSVAHAFDRHRPDVVLHAAAWTAVDAAESHRDEVFAANADGAAHVARAAAARGLPLLHISTDYVFDGTSARGYLPGDPPAPLGVYGASKRAGEEAVLTAAPALARIFRVAWLYDREGRNFLNTMLRAADAGTSLRVVDDQTGTRPTPATSPSSSSTSPKLRTACRPGFGITATEAPPPGSASPRPSSPSPAAPPPSPRAPPRTTPRRRSVRATPTSIPNRCTAHSGSNRWTGGWRWRSV